MKRTVSKCCQARIEYVKDFGNHHDECRKCRRTLEDDEIIEIEVPNK